MISEVVDVFTEIGTNFGDVVFRRREEFVFESVGSALSS
jgi:hypothetical protein